MPNKRISMRNAIYGPPPICKNNLSLWKSWLQPSIRPVCEGLLPSGPDGIRAGASLPSSRLQLFEPMAFSGFHAGRFAFSAITIDYS